MRLAILHGYELAGSGSNEYTRYLSRALARLGHEVHVLCREPNPESIAHVATATSWSADGRGRVVFEREVGEGAVSLHQLPHADVRPVYLTDKQRAGNVKSFESLSEEELSRYHELSAGVVEAVLTAVRPDLVHANHLVWQPSIVAETGHPFVVFPHGSSIEYTIRRDARYRKAALEALLAARGVITGNREVLDRILDLFPDYSEAIVDKSAIVGVGVDTSLFRPVRRDERRASISMVDAPSEGKTVALSRELVERLDRGELAALTDYRGRYDESSPDAGLGEKLDRIPWVDGRILLFVGALTAGKGLQTLVAALPAVLERHPSTHLVIVGSGAYREVLEALVHAIDRGRQSLFEHLTRRGFDLDRSELTGGWEGLQRVVPAYDGFAGRVHFLGRLPHQLLRHVAPCADLAVFPSVVPEAYPLVLMESVANGVFPLVTDFSGFSDGLSMLAELLGSELVDRLRLPYGVAERREGIVDRVCGMLDRMPADDERSRLHEIAVNHFDWAVRARQMTDAYRRFSAPET